MRNVTYQAERRTRPNLQRLSAMLTAAAMAFVLVGGVRAGGAGPVLYRINSGGVSQSGTPVWETDTVADPSPYVLLADVQNNKATTSQDGVTPDATVPSATNERIFASHRHDPPGGSPAQMFWKFPVPNGPIEVRLYFAETVFEASGERVFDVEVEGITVLNDFDVFAEVGHDVGTMRSFLVDVTDGNLDIGFFHEVQHPMISGIELIDWTGGPALSVTPQPISINALPGDSATETVTLHNPGADDGAGPALFVENVTITGTDAGQFSDDWDGPAVWLRPGGSIQVDVTYSGSAQPDTFTANLAVALDGFSSQNFPISGATVTDISSLSASPNTVEFGRTNVGAESQKTFTVSNTGSGTDSSIDLRSVSVSGAQAGSFVVTTPLPVTIAPGESQDILVRFAPASVGTHNAVLTLEHNGDNSPTTVSLSGSAQTGFTDIGNSVFQTEINWLAASGITRGCNPPDNTLFCPTDLVTRGQMAAFLHRALDDILTAGDTMDFVDDNDSVFEADIEWLAATGVTRGCNPPANDEFCPANFVTRGQMAAFLHRALEGTLTVGEMADFVDDDDSVFEADIEWLASTGVTRGCNPPANDRFCPNDFVTREQMAAFLYRALAG